MKVAGTRTMSSLLACLALAGASASLAGDGLRGDPAAIADAIAMVERMGGVTIWSGMKRLRLVHEWHPWNRLDTSVEHETLDLTGPRSRAERVSEVNHAVRAYSPESGRWDLDNGVLKRAGKEALARDLALFLATPGHPMKTGVLP